jgi:Holliday junction DNA helicase RuvA
MLARVTGTLLDLPPDRALVAVDAQQHIVVELLLPGFAQARLGGSIDKLVTLHTLVFLESINQGATFAPRVSGFLSADDKAFFELLVTTKGIGHRKALRALALPVHQIASAIADRDAKLLQTLPEIGKKTAETVILNLRDRVEPFLHAPAPGRAPEATADVPGPSGDGGGTLARDALQTLLQLGETRQQAVAWIDRLLAEDDAPDSVEALVAAAYRLKAG